MKPNLIEMQIQWHRQQTDPRRAAPRKCPVCSTIDLVVTERQGIEIDCCPTCRGVWLDRGELERLIEFSHQTMAGPRLQRTAYGHAEQTVATAPPHDRPGRLARKRSWLREIFE